MRQIDWDAEEAATRARPFTPDEIDRHPDRDRILATLHSIERYTPERIREMADQVAPVFNKQSQTYT